MAKRVWGLLIATVSLLGCSNSDKAASPGASGAAGAAGSSGAAGGSGSSGASGAAGTAGGLSSAWSRTGLSCTDLGKSCGNCTGDTICYQLTPDACVPRSEAGFNIRCGIGSCPSDAPYCIDDYCLTLSDASCFCTAGLGAAFAGCQITPADHLAADAAANACSAQGDPCGVSATMPPCCSGTNCAAFGADPFSCLQTCNSSTDCANGCCVPLTGSNVSVCGPASACP
jgi:hypothetical protein